MKRVAALALLVAALALFALLRLRAPAAESLVPVADTATSLSAKADELEASNAAAPSARSSVPDAAEGTRDARDSKAQPRAAATGPVRVEVLDSASARPIRGAVVRFGTPQVEAQTDEHGLAAFEFPIGTPLGSIRIDASDEGDPFVPYERELGEIVVEGCNELTIRVDRGADLRGFVRDAATGHPIAGATVYYTGLCSRPRTKSREDGSFELLGLLAGPSNRPGRVVFEHPRYFGTSRILEPTDLAPDAPRVVVDMRRGILLTGRIVDSSGKPAPRARIDLFSEGVRTTNADEDGHFEFGGLAESDHATLVVPTQSLLEGAILAGQRELGALSADQAELEVVVPAAVVLWVYAARPEGGQLSQLEFEVGGVEELVEGPRSPWSATRAFREGIVARGPGAQIEVYSGVATDTQPGSLALGKATVRTEHGVASPIAVHVQLSERGHLDVPALPAGVSEFEPEMSLLPKGAADIRFLDAATGLPIAQGRSITISAKGWINPEEVGPDGVLRLRGAPGTYVLHAQLDGGPREVLPIRIPLSGYAKAEWRVRSRP